MVAVAESDEGAEIGGGAGRAAAGTAVAAGTGGGGAGGGGALLKPSFTESTGPSCTPSAAAAACAWRSASRAAAWIACTRNCVGSEMLYCGPLRLVAPASAMAENRSPTPDRFLVWTEM